MEEKEYILGLDISTKTIGISLYENLGHKGKLIWLNHVTPKLKPMPKDKNLVLFEKVRVFESEFLEKYKNLNIVKVIIEEPLLRSNNVNTIGTLLKFNGMISRSIYETLNVVPDFISVYDSRKYAFPELMQKRTHNRKGEPYTEKQISKLKEVLFGGESYTVDKKEVIWRLVSELEPQIIWSYTKNKTLKKEVFDMCDSVAVTLGYMSKEGIWLPENREK